MDRSWHVKSYLLVRRSCKSIRSRYRQRQTGAVQAMESEMSPQPWDAQRSVVATQGASRSRSHSSPPLSLPASRNRSPCGLAQHRTRQDRAASPRTWSTRTNATVLIRQWGCDSGVLQEDAWAAHRSCRGAMRRWSVFLLPTRGR